MSHERRHLRLRRSFLAICALGAACSQLDRGGRARTVTIGTGDPGGVYFPLGQALARIFTERLAVTSEARPSSGSDFNVRLVEKGEFDLAFSMGNVAYAAFRGRPAGQVPNVRALAVLYANTVQIVAPRASPVLSMGDTRRRRVGVGPAGSGTEQAARVILQASGIADTEVDTRALTFSDAVAALGKGELDAGVFVASYPVPAITDGNAASALRLISLEPALTARLRETHPFFRPSVIPRGTYEGQKDDVATVEVDNLLLCRGDLDEELAYRLTKTLMEVLPELGRAHPAAGRVDLDRAPAAPIPLHPGAARYYRERQLFR